MKNLASVLTSLLMIPLLSFGQSTATTTLRQALKAPSQKNILNIDGGTSPGGGNILEGEFKSMARIGRQHAINLDLVNEDEANEWDSKIDSMIVRFTSNPIFHDGRQVDASNDRSNKIKVYQPLNQTKIGWSAKTKEEQVFLATHESLQLIGKDDGYEISSKVLIAVTNANMPKPWSCVAKCGGWRDAPYTNEISLKSSPVYGVNLTAASAYAQMQHQCGPYSHLFVGVEDLPNGRQRLIDATLINACVKN